MRATGLVRDHDEVVKRRVSIDALRRKRMAASAPPPQSVTWKSFITGPNGPGVKDQGPFGKCVGESFSSAATTRMAIAGTPIDPVSDWGVYKLARCIDRGGDLSQPLTDSGTSPGSAIAAFQQWGVASAKTWGEEDASSVNTEPTLAQLEAASDFELEGSYFLTSTGDQLVIDIMTELALGYPITFSLAASGSEFQGYSSGVLGQLSGPLDHENFLTDYTLQTPGDYSSIILEPCNSWGQSWGMGGFYYGNRAFVDQCADWCVHNFVPKGKER